LAGRPIGQRKPDIWFHGPFTDPVNGEFFRWLEILQGEICVTQIRRIVKPPVDVFYFESLIGFPTSAFALVRSVMLLYANIIVAARFSGLGGVSVATLGRSTALIPEWDLRSVIDLELPPVGLLVRLFLGDRITQYGD